MIEHGEGVPAGLFGGGGVSTVVPLTGPVPEGALWPSPSRTRRALEQPAQDPALRE